MNVQDVDGRTKQMLSLEQKQHANDCSCTLQYTYNNNNMQCVRLHRSVKSRPSAKSSATPSLLKGTLGNCCLTKGSGLMRHVTNYSLASHLAHGQQQVIYDLYAKIGHMLGKMFSSF